MNFHEAYNRIMSEQNQIALATCAGGALNVRIVNFCCDPERQGVLYFSSFFNNPKIAEFQESSAVAFTTVPKSGNAHVRVKEGTVSKSSRSIFDLQDIFAAKIPGYGDTIRKAGADLVLFELHFLEAQVTVGLGSTGKIML